VKRVSRLLVPLLLAAALLAADQIVESRELLDPDWTRWFRFAALVPLIFFAVRLIDFITFDLVTRRRRPVNAPLLLREIFAVTLYLFAFAWAISAIFNKSVTGFLATGTVLAAVLGLALQDTLGNVFAGIALHLEDTFDVGDVIRSGDHIGVVEAIRWRATRIRTFNNNLVVLPNSILSRERVEVFPRTGANARILSLGLDYNIPPERVISVLTEAAVNVEGVVREMPCFARVAGFGEWALTYEIKYHMHDYSQRDRIDADIRRAVWHALHRNGIPIPYPIRQYQRYTPPAAERELAADALLARLHDVDILSPLSGDARTEIAAAARVHYFSRGETIIRRGTAGNSMFVVHAGDVAVRVDGHDVAQLGAGAVVGEMALLTGEARTADVVALSDVIAIEIAKPALEPVLRDYPEMAEAISAKIASRRETGDAMRDDAHDAHRTVLSRIRSYFGL
jgi:small-conductance mechanosensitive channel/CRP-like cAMP-binding protein